MPRVWTDHEDCLEGDLVGTLVLQVHQDRGGSLDLRVLLERMALMDLLENKECKEQLEAQVCLVFLEKKDLLVRRERREMEVFLASLGLLVSVEREAVQELQDFLDRKDKKENQLRDLGVRTA